MKTNSLTHTIYTKSKDGDNLIIKIRLNDECKNGHQDFAITGDIYQKDKPKIDKYHLSGGCIHDEILAARPDLKIFVDLHLCDYKGIPMHPIANGLYFLKEGFNNCNPNDTKFAQEYCDYYRITLDQYNVLKESKNKIQYYLNLKRLKILDQWEKQANEAIKLLENMTGHTFVVDSVRTQLIEPSKKEIQQELRRQKNGYYSKENELLREKRAMKLEIQKLNKELNKELNKRKLEYHVKKEVLTKMGVKALNNCIFYNHSSTLSFNWRGYDRLDESFINEHLPSLDLPESVKVEIK